MDGIENLLSMLDVMLSTKKKRHIAGGILISISLLFGGLAVTVVTLGGRTEDENEQEYE